MFSRLFNKIFPFKIVSLKKVEENSKLFADNIGLTLKVRELQEIVKTLEQEKKTLAESKNKKDNRFVIEMGLKDPSPKDREARSLYVARVAGLHKDILEPKFRQMISELHSMLDEASNDREYDQALKGAIYFAKEVINWGNAMVNEQLAIQTEQNNGSPEDKIKS